MTGFRRYASTVAFFATVLYFAFVIAVFGVTSLFAGIDVVDDPQAGLLAGPIAVAAATLLVFGCLLWIALRVPEQRQRVSPLAALGIAVGAYLAYALLGGIAVFVGAGDPVAGLLFLGTELTRPFAPTAGALGFLIALLYMLLLASRIRQRGRPEWPWEKHDDD
ncbi:DUF6121 family protein [Gryllotalpicola ginsengisoli]|uniref:DUF6121 family protein n=1 Tax=Gryllotalpicola ginsengisoli TaxID=444608 RepID=UPI0003B348F0|nr:DUF6121 family protein [Gryllotalpicola ginsengisoli]